MRNIKSEFADYDSILPSIKGFIDTSWHNDSCPSISKEIKDDCYYQIFCDYLDENKREYKGNKRYWITLQSNGIYSEPLFCCDTTEELKAWIKLNLKD